MTRSPRPSIERPQTPNSPFLHNLQQRLRKSSTASRASSQDSETTQTNYEAALSQTHDTRSTKRYLLSILRDDWEYSTAHVNENNPTLQREASGYRLRDESVSEYESGPRNKNDDAYRFDSPDDVGVTIERRRARKRRLLEQEMTWNDGLRIWTLRRDAWTGAVLHKAERQSSNGGGRKMSFSRSSKKKSSSDSAPQSLSPTTDRPLATSNGTDTYGAVIDTAQSPTQPDIGLRDGPYLPIYPPLIPASNTLRSRIKPAAYPTLYSKVVVQGLAPNVPIPLNHMINALVEGWKAEGNWPPQAAEPQTVTGGRTRPKKVETAFQKWKRDQDDKRQLAAQRAQEAKYTMEEPEHKGVRRSITGAVKKAFGKKDPDDDIEEQLEKLGLTFESQEEDEDGATALHNGHV
ncbi:hypothetical protein LTR05_003785 [Lithohypha guttulata]|uniref:Gag1-like clamp domain-containing protein n=1 Tax=Lithohypha guttulata TaxID=1690604 RepID=A0AAN7T0B3_9EURO|nr:hypothetical protein LTR05_003785 [Lithohypha guttulata]